ncbi:xylan glycosyltransferase MUCI21-like [Lathyrus oleraceus]|uniref:xylan glycosyltransferase MUCI21-like n=1 Tax=Pisum sativum TaxID=3888 RepID=UPI0021D21CBD|nr:xylan glycosyltransferase MUCI21-like [Pisum sativum]
MMEKKTSLLSKSAICFAIFGLIFVFQITVFRDATIWKEKFRQIFSISKWSWDLKANSTALITCDRSNRRFDICSMNGPTLLNQTSLTLFSLATHTRTQHHIHVKIQPYTLKSDKNAMKSVREFTLTSAPPKSSQCDVTHHSPALIFNGRGYNGNFYHEINDIFIPLFITMNSLFLEQDVILVIADGMSWWFKKYDDLLSTFSPRHKIIKTNNVTTTTHCFPSAVVGLIKHGPVTIDPKLLPYPKTLLDFHALLRSAYIKSNNTLSYPNNNDKPRLTLVNRKGSSRVLLNQEEVIKLAEDIGFNVNVFDSSKDPSVANTYRLIHSSNVLLGVHGAGLTNLFFLKQGSVVVQIVPIGLEWPSKACYENPDEFLGLEYIGYKVNVNESSLSWEYGADSLMVKDPSTFAQGKWDKQKLYLKQNVKIDLFRFKKYLTLAYEKVKTSMNNTS